MAWAPMPRTPAAVASIFAAKGRPADHPLIVHVAALMAACRLAHFAGALPAFAAAPDGRPSGPAR